MVAVKVAETPATFGKKTGDGRRANRENVNFSTHGK